MKKLNFLNIEKDVIEQINDYFDKSPELSIYTPQLIIRSSNHPEDNYLYKVLAYNNNSGEYALWNTYNASAGSLNHGIYNIQSMKNALDILSMNLYEQGIDYISSLQRLNEQSKSDVYEQAYTTIPIDDRLCEGNVAMLEDILMDKEFLLMGQNADVYEDKKARVVIASNGGNYVVYVYAYMNGSGYCVWQMEMNLPNFNPYEKQNDFICELLLGDKYINDGTSLATGMSKEEVENYIESNSEEEIEME